MAISTLQRSLESIGLDSREARLYIAGLQLGSAPASEYSRQTSLNRITAYNTLELLSKRGVFTVVKKQRGKWYTPVAPDQLAFEARKNVQALDRVMPELRSLQGSEYRKPNVEFYEGWEGVRRVYEDTLTAESELLNFANSAIVRANWQNYDEEYVAERVKRGIYLRGIAPNDEAGRMVQTKDAQCHREIRLVSKKDFDFNNEIKIYDNKVAIISFGGTKEDMFGVIIESKEVAETQRQIFEMAWRYAELTKK
ncbi:MAG: helix-turn-helix domain-containing protein [Patescibacteria group bacterium]